MKFLKVIAYVFLFLVVLGALESIFGEKKTEEPQDATKPVAIDTPQESPKQPKPKPKQRFEITESALVKKINTLNSVRDLPQLKVQKKMSCELACSATYLQGRIAGYTFTREKDDERITSVLQMPVNDGTAMAAMNSMLVMITVAQSLIPEAEHERMATELKGMIGAVGEGRQGTAVVGGVEFNLMNTKGAGLWFIAEPAKQ